MEKPGLKDFLNEGLSFKQACMAIEAYYSCAIEGAHIDTDKEFKELCKKMKKECV